MKQQYKTLLLQQTDLISTLCLIKDPYPRCHSHVTIPINYMIYCLLHPTRLSPLFYHQALAIYCPCHTVCLSPLLSGSSSLPFTFCFNSIRFLDHYFFPYVRFSCRELRLFCVYLSMGLSCLVLAVPISPVSVKLCYAPRCNMAVWLSVWVCVSV